MAGTTDPLLPYVARVALARASKGPHWWTVDGTLVFADISGFTRLTEKLSEHGKAGAEEIVRTISRVFTELLGRAGAEAHVLKFSGDALLLLYDGPDHEQRAVHAALVMRGALRAVGGIDTSRGRVRLRMSVGVNSGPVVLMLCGGDHLELHVLGPAATATTTLESAARPGQVLAGATTLSALEGARLGPAAGTAAPVQRVAAPDAAEPPPRPVAHDATPLVPPPLRTLLRADTEHEHRRATIGFVSFRGVDRLLEQGRGDEVFDRVQRLTTTAMDALAEYDVLLTATDIAADGGKLMLTAGAPAASGDEEARMLLVARRLVEADCGLTVRAGVNTGRVFVGAVGAAHRRTYSTMGAATNLAARVLGAARDGEVLATAAVIDAVGGRFRVGATRALDLRGVAAAVPAAPVEDRVTRRTTLGRTSDRAPLVGRDDELARLGRLMGGTAEGHGTVVELTGAPGSGRTRLVRELLEQAPRHRRLVVTGDPWRRTTPYHVAGLLLRRALGVPRDAGPEQVVAACSTAIAQHAPGLADVLPLLARVLGHAVDDTPTTAALDERFRRQRTEQATVTLLRALLTAPTAIVIDDADAVDDASAGLLTALLRQAPGQPWFVAVVREATYDEPRGLHRGRGYSAAVVDVGPLADAAARELVDLLAERTALPSHRRPDVVERAHGNPRFLLALVDAAASGTEQLPRTVEAIIAAEIDTLPTDARRRLRYAAVLGNNFPGALLDTAFGELELHADDEAWDHLGGLLTRTGSDFTFRSRLVRDVAYEGLSYRRRRHLHGLAADAMAELGTDDATIALHLTRAERWAPAWEVSVTAAEAAAAGGANVVAGELFEMALTAAARLSDLDPDEVVAAALACGRAWRRSGVHERARAAYTAASRAATSVGDRLEITLRRATLHERAGAYTHALRAYGRVLATVADEQDPVAAARLKSRAHAGYAMSRLGQGRHEEAVAHARDALAAAESAGDDGLVARAAQLAARCHEAAGDVAAAERCRDLALPRFAAVGDHVAQGTVLFDLARDALRGGRPEVALWMYGQSREVRERVGDVDRAAATVHAIGETRRALGEHDAARRAFAEALRLWRGAGSMRGVSEAAANLGEALLEAGEPGGALSLLAEAARVADDIGADDLLPRVQLVHGEVLLAHGRTVEAFEAATAALARDGGLDAAAAARAHVVRAEALDETGGSTRAAAERATAARLDPAAAPRAEARARIPVPGESGPADR